MRVLVVGAGISGLTAAVLFKDAGHDVLVMDTRKHIGGNCHDVQIDECMVHLYGPHIFHTKSDAVWKFVNRFSGFVPYEHKVLARSSHSHCLLSIPYNKHTESVIGRKLSDEEIINYFFKDYSQVMWGMPWEELPAEVTQRVPQRRADNDQRYFTDKHQGMPTNGYCELFNSMAKTVGTDNIALNVDSESWRDITDVDITVFTGSIDSYYKYTIGKLPYRTLDIETISDYRRQPAAVVNECNLLPLTRTTDYSWLYQYTHMNHRTVVTREYPRLATESTDVLYYPITWGPDADLYAKYAAYTPERPTLFCGRLGSFKYMNIDSVILDTTETVTKFLGDL